MRESNVSFRQGTKCITIGGWHVAPFLFYNTCEIIFTEMVSGLNVISRSIKSDRIMILRNFAHFVSGFVGLSRCTFGYSLRLHMKYHVKVFYVWIAIIFNRKTSHVKIIICKCKWWWLVVLALGVQLNNLNRNNKNCDQFSVCFINLYLQESSLVPRTNFECGKRAAGYYADIEAGCQVYLSN